MPGVSFNSFPFYWLGHGLSLGLGLTAGWPVNLRIHLSPHHSPSPGILEVHCHTQLALHECWGPELRLSHLGDKWPIGPPHQPLSFYFSPIW